ncbi:uncharacterized protein LOC143252353 [Tachypleus tridentatus]|uniref:uncharacterized protein LOC143252353 n=1 Tax=Tachypleus tridentatus TaxID=6853 RepID=UPI003FCF0745
MHFCTVSSSSTSSRISRTEHQGLDDTSEWSRISRGCYHPETTIPTQMDPSRDLFDCTHSCGSSGLLQKDEKDNPNQDCRSRIPTKKHKTETEGALNPSTSKLLNSQNTKSSAILRIPASCSVPHSLALSGHSQFSLLQGSSYSSPCRGRSNLVQPSAAASFFARAAERLNLQSSRKKQKHHTIDKSARTTLYRRNVLLPTPPQLPPGYLKISSRRESPGLGKVKVMLRISNAVGAASCLTIDPRKKQVAVYDSSALSTQSGTSSSASKQAGINAPKMFAFDAVFTPENSQAEVCATTLMDVLHAVVSGTDGCVFSYGYPGLGKTTTMLGQTDGSQEIGVIPCAISWLFQLISDQKDKSGSRFSVRVSAVEVAGKEQTIKDLLATFASGSEGGGTSPGMFLQDEILLGAQLANICELRTPTTEKALFFLDAALKARNVPASEEDRMNSHFCYTLHVYQYRSEKGSKIGVAGGRSRLYFFDFGSCEKQVKSREVAARQPLSLSGLGSVLLALFNGQKHVPYRHNKLTQLVTMALGNLTCRAAMIAHVSPFAERFSETLFTIQLASRVHRLRRKKLKQFSSKASGDGEGKDMCQPCVRSDAVSEDEAASRVSDPDYTSGSEQSCVTAIFVGNPDIPRGDSRLLSKEKHQKTQKYSSKSSVSQTISTKAGSSQSSTTDLKASGSSGRKSASLLRPSTSSTPTFKGRTQKKSTLGVVSPHVPKQYQPKDPSGSLPSDQITRKPLIQAPRKLSIKHRLELTKQKHLSPSRPSTPTKNLLSQREQNVASDELWIDGPRFAKPKFDSKTLQYLQKEQWVDGPAVCGAHNDLKKTMIKRWVQEHSFSSTIGTEKKKREVWIDLPASSKINDQVSSDSTQSDGIRRDSMMEESTKQSSLKVTTSSNTNKKEVEKNYTTSEETSMKSNSSASPKHEIVVKPQIDCLQSCETKSYLGNLCGKDSCISQLNQEENVSGIQPTYKVPTNQSLQEEKGSVAAFNDSEDKMSTFNTSELSNINTTDDEDDDTTGSNELIRALQSLHSNDSIETTDPDDLEEETEMRDSSVQVSEEDIVASWLRTRALISENPLPEVDQLELNNRYLPFRVYSEENICFNESERDTEEMSEKLESVSLPDDYRAGFDYQQYPFFEMSYGQPHYIHSLQYTTESEDGLSDRSNVLALKLKRLAELREQSQQIRKKIIASDSMGGNQERRSTMPGGIPRPSLGYLSYHNQTPSDEDIANDDALSIKSEPAEVNMNVNPLFGLRLEAFYQELHRMYPTPRLASSFVVPPRISKNDERLLEPSSMGFEEILQRGDNSQFLHANTSQDVERPGIYCKRHFIRTLRHPDGVSNEQLNKQLLHDEIINSHKDSTASFHRRTGSMDSREYENRNVSSQGHTTCGDECRVEKCCSIQHTVLTTPSMSFTALPTDNSNSPSLDNHRTLSHQQLSSKNRSNVDLVSMNHPFYETKALSANFERVPGALANYLSHSSSKKFDQQSSTGQSSGKRMPLKPDKHWKLLGRTGGFLKKNLIPRSISSTNEDYYKPLSGTQRKLSLQNSEQSTEAVSTTLPSPYSKITKAKRAHCSSDYSDSCELVSARIESRDPKISAETHCSGNSSGYESMLRDSEGTSCSRDSESEGPRVRRANEQKDSKKKTLGSFHRSRSAPARTAPANGGGRSQSPSPVSSQPRPIRDRSHRQGRSSKSGDEEVSCAGFFCCRMMDLY